MKRILLLSVILLFGLAGWAQDVPKVEIPLGFSMINVHPNLTPITSFNVFGGGGQIDFNFGPVFGIKADFMGYTQGSGLRQKLTDAGYTVTGNLSGNMFTYMFGPQFKKHTGRVQPVCTGGCAVVRQHRQRAAVSHDGHDRQQGHPEVSVFHLRAVVAGEGEEDPTVTAGTECDSDAEERSANADRVS